MSDIERLASEVRSLGDSSDPCRQRLRTAGVKVSHMHASDVAPVLSQRLQAALAAMRRADRELAEFSGSAIEYAAFLVARAAQSPARGTAVDHSLAGAGVQPSDPEPDLPVDGDGLVSAEYRDTSTRPVFPADGAIDFDSPVQGALGDCYVIASLSALAGTHPNIITDAIEGQGQSSLLVRGRSVANTLPVDKGNGEQIFATSDGHSTTWAGHLEKAYAQEQGGYPAIGNGGWPRDVLRWLTGKPGSTIDPAWISDSELAGRLRGASENPTVAYTYRPKSGSAIDLEMAGAGVIPGHAYSVRGLDDQGRVLLHNPWGFGSPPALTLGQFRRFYSGVDWVDLP